MPKLRRGLSIFLAIWLCVMLVTFTYTWVSRNWTPSIQGDDINVQSSGALVISLLGDHTDANSKVILNDVVGLGVNKSFTFRQVSSQDGENFFWKDFTPTVDEWLANIRGLINYDMARSTLDLKQKLEDFRVNTLVRNSTVRYGDICF